MDIFQNKDIHPDIQINEERRPPVKNQIGPTIIENSDSKSSKKTSYLLKKLINPFGYADITVE